LQIANVCQITHASKDCAGTDRENPFLLSPFCHVRCAFLAPTSGGSGLGPCCAGGRARGNFPPLRLPLQPPWHPFPNARHTQTLDYLHILVQDYIIDNLNSYNSGAERSEEDERGGELGDLDDEQDDDQGSDDLDGWLMDGDNEEAVTPTKEGEGSDAFPKIDVDGRAQIFEGECALVCQDVAPPAEGVTKPIALDGVLAWIPSYRAVCATSIVDLCRLRHRTHYSACHVAQICLINYPLLKCVLMT
jgi:hypothetical protein